MRAFWQMASDELPAGAQFDAWHAAFSAYNDVQVPVAARPAFRARATYWAFGSLTLAVNEATPLALIRSDRVASREGLEHAVVVVGVSGQSRTVSRGETYDLGPGDVAFGNMRDGYDFRLAPQGVGRWIDLTSPPELAVRLGELGSGRPHAGRSDATHARFLARFLTGLVRRLPEFCISDGPALEQALLSLIAATQVDPMGGAARLSTTAGLVIGRARAAATIERELSSARLTVERVSDLTGIPRTTLYRLFAADDGVASYIRMRRLEALRGDLANVEKRRIGVAELAEARGFHCLSTLNRAFRDRFGCTPTELRGRAAANAPAPTATGIGAVVEFLRRQTLA
jgi:AraC-like DNA-binding protein